MDLARKVLVERGLDHVNSFGGLNGVGSIMLQEEEIVI